ncbi:MAG: hypothetical protein R6U40_07565, partial [Desulfobacterales bacterium]
MDALKNILEENGFTASDPQFNEERNVYELDAHPALSDEVEEMFKEISDKKQITVKIGRGLIHSR